MKNSGSGRDLKGTPWTCECRRAGREENPLVDVRTCWNSGSSLVCSPGKGQWEK